jgi:TldD protein
MMKLIRPQRCLSVLSHGDFSEIYYERSKSLSMRWEEGRFEQATHGVDEGFGLRYRTGHETRFGSVDGGAEDLLGALSKTLTSGLLASTPKPFLAAPHKNVVSSPQPAFSKSIDEKMRWIRKLYESASHPLLRQIQIGYGEVEKEIQILNSRGVWTYEIRSSLTLSVRVVAEKNGLQQTAYEVISGTGGWELFEKTSPEQLVRIVQKRALDRLSALPAPAGELPIIIAGEAGGTLIHEALGHPLEADLVQKGISPIYKGKIGQVVANEKVSVYEDPTMSGQRGFYGFDDERDNERAKL